MSVIRQISCFVVLHDVSAFSHQELDAVTSALLYLHAELWHDLT